eukprot:2045547-Alexandrium_andersonii.AAC.1
MSARLSLHPSVTPGFRQDRLHSLFGWTFRTCLRHTVSIAVAASELDARQCATCTAKRHRIILRVHSKRTPSECGVSQRVPSSSEARNNGLRSGRLKR